MQTATGLTFTARRVTSLRERYGIPARGKRKDADAPTVSVPVAAGELGVSAGELGVSAASLYHWIDQGLIAAEQAGPRSPLRVRLDASVLAKFRQTVPDDYMPAAEARRELGVSRKQWLAGRTARDSRRAQRILTMYNAA